MNLMRISHVCSAKCPPSVSAGRSVCPGLWALILFFFALGAGFTASEASEIEQHLARLRKPQASVAQKKAAARWLGQHSNSSVAPHLAQVFRETTQREVRQAILKAIAHIPQADILSSVIDLRREPTLIANERLILEQTVWTFRKYIDVAAWTRLLQESHDPYEHQTALWILGLIEARSSRPQVLACLEQGTPDVQEEALLTLARFGQAQDGAVCAKYAKDALTPRVRFAAQRCRTQRLLPKSKRYPHRVTFHTQITTPLNGFAPQHVHWYASPPQGETQELAANALDEPRTPDSRLYPKTFEAPTKTPVLLTGQDVGPERYYSTDIDRLKSEIATFHTDLGACYDKHGATMKGPREGRVVMSISVNALGQVTLAKVLKKSTLKHRPLHTCLIETLRTLKFSPMKTSSVTLEYSMDFVVPNAASTQP